MCAFVLSDGTQISDYKEPYIIAEMNTSHNGNIGTAKNMIDKAKQSGCSCVKFQSWTEETLYSNNYYVENPMSKRIVKKFSLSPEQLKELSQYSKEKGIHFSSTPYSKKEVDFLIDECNAAFVKVSSMEINNYPYLEYIAQKKAPIILSTGMADMEEIKRAVRIIENAGNKNICLLHCVSIYPAKIETINLNNIIELRKEFKDYTIGFSDHTIGIEIPIAATALGVSVIEKHFTLDKTKIGMDNQMATEPDEMEQMIRMCNNVCKSLGGYNRVVLPEELEQRKKMRRSIVASRSLRKDSIITENDLDAKRPGTGLPPERMYELIGKKLNRDIECDELIFEKDFI